MKDLVILSADKNMQFALKGILGRSESLEIREIEPHFIVHPGRDGGARKTGPELLRLERSGFSHALLILDYEGCGADVDARALERELDHRLTATWGPSGKSIVIEPELDVWVWGSDHAIQPAINWPRDEPIRTWLRSEGFSFDVNEKPIRPKEAFQAVLRVSQLPRSSSIYQSIAERLSLRNCDDPAFVRLRNKLVEWFSVEAST